MGKRQSRGRLGQHLIEAGHITAKDLERALEIQRVAGGHLGTNLLEMQTIEEDELLEAIGRLHENPTVSGTRLREIPHEVSSKVPRELIRRHNIVPFALHGNTVYIASQRPGDIHIENEVTLATSRLTRTFLGLEVRVQEALHRHHGHSLPLRFSRLAATLDGEPLPERTKPQQSSRYSQPDTPPPGSGPSSADGASSDPFVVESNAAAQQTDWISADREDFDPTLSNTVGRSIQWQNFETEDSDQEEQDEGSDSSEFISRFPSEALLPDVDTVDLSKSELVDYQRRRTAATSTDDQPEPGRSGSSTEGSTADQTQTAQHRTTHQELNAGDSSAEKSAAKPTSDPSQKPSSDPYSERQSSDRLSSAPQSATQQDAEQPKAGPPQGTPEKKTADERRSFEAREAAKLEPPRAASSNAVHPFPFALRAKRQRTTSSSLPTLRDDTETSVEAEELDAITTDSSAVDSALLDAHAALLEATNRDAVGRIVMEGLRPFFKRRLLLAKRGDQLLGWRADGPGVRPRNLANVRFAVKDGTPFLAIQNGSRFWLSSYHQDAGFQALTNILGPVRAPDCMILPLRAGKHIVGFLYGDNERDTVTGQPLQDFLEFSEAAGAAFERIIHRLRESRESNSQVETEQSDGDGSKGDVHGSNASDGAESR